MVRGSTNKLQLMVGEGKGHGAAPWFRAVIHCRRYPAFLRWNENRSHLGKRNALATGTLADFAQLWYHSNLWFQFPPGSYWVGPAWKYSKKYQDIAQWITESFQSSCQTFAYLPQSSLCKLHSEMEYHPVGWLDIISWCFFLTVARENGCGVFRLIICSRFVMFVDRKARKRRKQC